MEFSVHFSGCTGNFLVASPLDGTYKYASTTVNGLATGKFRPSLVRKPDALNLFWQNLDAIAFATCHLRRATIAS